MRDFSIKDVPCRSCQDGYSGHHACESPDYCPCDRTINHDTETLAEGLTADEQDALVKELFAEDDSCVHNLMGMFDLIDDILAARIMQARAGRLIPEPDNHHNAAVCPYCTPVRRAGEGALRERVEALTSALERTEANFIAAVNGRPVRDMAENLAENRAALTTAGDPS